MTIVRQGQCLCGAVRYRTEGELTDVLYCHCSQCRRQSGHFYATTNIRDDFLTIEGEGNLRWYASSDHAKRGFCAQCGSILFWKDSSSDVTSLMVGSLDSPTFLQGRAHIFVADKGDYYDIEDGLPLYAQSAP